MMMWSELVVNTDPRHTWHTPASSTPQNHFHYTWRDELNQGYPHPPQHPGLPVLLGSATLAPVESMGAVKEPYQRGARPKKKTRTRRTLEQLEILEEVFRENRHPSKEVKVRLAIEFGISIRQVQVWFQNRWDISSRVEPPALLTTHHLLPVCLVV